MSSNQRRKAAGDIQSVKTLNDVAVGYYEMGLYELSYKIWNQLYDKLVELKGGLENERLLPVISCNMGTVLRRKGEYERAFAVCRQGLLCCFGTGAIAAAPELSFQLAALHLRFGEKEHASVMYLFGKQCLRWIRQKEWCQPIEAFMERDFILCCQE